MFNLLYLVRENDLEYGGDEAQYLSHSVLQNVEGIVFDGVEIVLSQLFRQSVSWVGC